MCGASGTDKKRLIHFPPRAGGVAWTLAPSHLPVDWDSLLSALPGYQTTLIHSICSQTGSVEPSPKLLFRCYSCIFEEGKEQPEMAQIRRGEFWAPYLHTQHA